MPERIRRRRTAGWRMPEGAVYVGRGTKWGNPFIVGKALVRAPAENGAAWAYEGRLHATPGTRTFFCTGTDDIGMPVGFWHDVRHATVEECVTMFRHRFERTDPSNVGVGLPLDVVRAELAGRDLACWCPPDGPCHVDVLLELANREA